VAGNGCGAIAMTNICLMENMENIDLDEIISVILLKNQV
jgi:hypothetical protein